MPRRLSDGTIVPDMLIADLNIVRGRFDGEVNPHVYTAPDLSVTPYDKDGMWRDECPNCGCPRGTGQFLMPTGDKAERPYYFGGSSALGIKYKWQMRAYPCPVCQDALKTPHSSLLDGCGLVQAEDLALTPHDVYWGDWPARADFERTLKFVLHQFTSVKPSGWVTFVGPFGCGKTFALKLLTMACVNCGIEALYVTAPEIGNELFDGIKGNKRVSEVVERYKRVRVLLIDQLDWVRETTAGGDEGYAAEQLRTFLDFRYDQRARIATVFAINLRWWQMGGGRTFAPIFDRMRQGQVAFTELTDVRKILQEASGL